MKSKNQGTMAVKSRMRMEIKEISSQGTFEGILSPYGNVDDGQDVVEKGAYSRTLQDHGNKIPLLWQHRPDVPIGELTLDDRPDGLWCKGKLLMELQAAKDAYACIKERIIKGLSIGFESIKDSIEGGVRHLKEIRLYEGSIVTFPMNEFALVTSVKGLTGQKGDFVEELTEIQILATFWQMQTALEESLRSLLWAELTREEKISACETVLAQFVDAFSQYFPTYLDALAARYGPSETWGRQEIELKSSGKTKRVDGVDLTADCFAYIGDKDDTSTWKLPIKFPGDEEKTKAHIRNALARFSQTEGIPEDERPKVLAKIKAAAKKHGIDVSDDDGKSLEPETKTGAMISATNAETIKSACSGINGHVKSLLALLENDKAGATTLSTKAATAPEPAEDHSATETLSGTIEEFRALLQ